MSEYPMKLCGSLTRSGGACKKQAGWGTNHVGDGRCRLHGGRTPIKHGRYSKVTREQIRGLIEEYESDPDPLNVLPEIAAARALFADFINRYGEWREALLAWHQSYTESEKPREVLDISDAYRLLTSVARIAQAEKKLKLEGAISRRDLLRIFTEQRRAIEAVADPQTAERILEAFSAIRLA